MKKGYLSACLFITLYLSIIQTGETYGQNTSLPAKESTPEESEDSLRQVRAGVKIMTRYRADSILLRWAPDRAGAWQWGNRTGWHIERTEIDAENGFDPATFRRLTSVPIKLASAKQWEAVPDLETENRYVAVAAQCALGQPVNVGTDIISRSEDATSRFGFALLAADLSSLAANLLGLRWVDRSVEPGKQYVYKIYPAGPTPGYPIDTAYAVSNTFQDMIPAPVSLSKVEIGDQLIQLYWSRSAFQPLYSAYWIERSDMENGPFQKLTELPFLPMLSNTIEEPSDLMAYSDSTIQNYKKYWYRIVGITPFGDDGPPSIAVEAIGRDRTPPPAPIKVSTRHLGGTRVEIRWEMPPCNEPYHLFVGRTDKYNFSAEALHTDPLAAETRVYTDENASLVAPNYYVVSAVDTAGNAAFSLIEYGDIRDTFPPAPPQGLYATCDTNGLVRISWNKSPERDIKGYLLFFANAADHAFGTLSNEFIQDTFFLDTMNLLVLTEERFFRLKAIDWHDNYSTLSDTFRLKLPDIVPPVPPLFSDYSVSKNGILVKWIASSSDDVTKHFLLRQTEGTNTWEEIATISDINIRSFLDNDVHANQFYKYTIQAEDDAGLRSEQAFPLRIKMPDWEQRPTVRNLSAQKSSEVNLIELNWVYQISGNYKFVIYRAENDGPFLTIAALPGEKRSFIDSGVHKGKLYQYAVKTVFADGKSSPFSSIITVPE